MRYARARKKQVPAVPEQVVRELTHVHVPLTLYIGNERRIKGDAVVTGNGIEAYFNGEVDSYRDAGEFLLRMIELGAILDVSVAFNAPPAVPLYKDGKIKWMRNF